MISREAGDGGQESWVFLRGFPSVSETQEKHEKVQGSKQGRWLPGWQMKIFQVLGGSDPLLF